MRKNVYDALNRAKSKSYNDNPLTPQVDYYYDNAAMPSGAPSFDRGSATGRLVAVTYGAGSGAGTYRGYDAMGQVLRQYQRTDSVNYLVEATYNRASAMASETYPSVPGAGDRRTVTYTPDAAGRLASLNSSATTYAAAASLSGVLYKPHGGIETETLGNSLIHQQTYNSRLQTTAVKLGTPGNPTSVLNLTYDYGSTDNNGNLKGHVNTIGTLAITDAFTYDSLNRLLSTTETSTGGNGWTETNNYDRYGNRAIDLGGGSFSLTFDAANNRITSKTYDSVGNLTVDGTSGYGYDAENHMITVNSSVAYTYDGEGRRVRKLFGENTRFIYGISGELITEFSGSNGNLTKEYISGGGMMAVIVPSVGTRYTTTDHLGSPKVVTNSSGVVVGRHDYKPFGIELLTESGRTSGLGYGATDGVRDKFTGYERDDETGLDYAQARYYASAQGRFASSDPLIASGRATNPQSWNRYSYVLNKPLNLIDPSGLSASSSAGGCSAEFSNCDENEGGRLAESDYNDRVRHSYNAIAATRAARDNDWDTYNDLMAQDSTLALTPQGTSQAQNHLLTSVTVLGNEVKISYGRKVSAGDQLIAGNSISVAADLINEHVADLTPEEKKAIGKIRSFSVVGPGEYLGATGSGLALDMTNIKSSSAYLASLFGHEGQHRLNAGKYSGPNLWKDEQSAGMTQLGIGNKLGFTSAERIGLEQWTSDSNRAILQRHMKRGVKSH